MTDEKIERGAAEEGSPLTPTEVKASQRPPSEGDSASGGQSTTGEQPQEGDTPAPE